MSTRSDHADIGPLGMLARRPGTPRILLTLWLVSRPLGTQSARLSDDRRAPLGTGHACDDHGPLRRAGGPPAPRGSHAHLVDPAFDPCPAELAQVWSPKEVGRC